MFEEGFSTQATFDTKNLEFLNEGKYLFIKNFEVYHTNDRIIGFFPFFGDRVADKKIQQNSYYNQFIKNLKNIKKKFIHSDFFQPILSSVFYHVFVFLLVHFFSSVPLLNLFQVTLKNQVYK